MYSAITDALDMPSRDLQCKKHAYRHRNIPGQNEYVTEAYSEARDAFRLQQSYNCILRSGPVCKLMNKTLATVKTSYKNTLFQELFDMIHKSVQNDNVAYY